MYAKPRFWLAGCALTLTLVSGCTLQKKDDGGEFRDAVPQSESIALSGPDAASGPSTTAAAAPSLRPLAAGPAPTAYAKWYGLTREMRGSVNKITAGVLGSVWVVIHTVPSATTLDSATWGPWNDELTPAVYRFRVMRIAPDEYTYVLEGRSKSRTSDDDYQAVLNGHGYGKPSAQHGQGTFKIDVDVAKALDPFDNQENSAPSPLITSCLTTSVTIWVRCRAPLLPRSPRGATRTTASNQWPTWTIRAAFTSLRMWTSMTASSPSSKTS